MSKSILLICGCLAALLLYACSKPDATTNRQATLTSTTPAASPAATTTTTASAGDKIGVTECDNFIAAYDTCISTKVPGAARAQFKTAATWRTEWKKLAANPQTRATLAGVCKTQLDHAKTQMKSYGCTF